MFDFLPPPLADVLSQFLRLVPEDTKLYLVGGAVRDMLRKSAVHDLDLVMSGDVLASARRLADAIGAAYYPLDETRQTARIVLQKEKGQRDVIDIASLRGEDLEADLRGRDFTINAMALDLRHPEQLIDPLGGAQDILDRKLRACSPQALQEDPVRVVRAVRLAFAYRLKITPETQSWLRQAARLLPEVSAERQRDELFRILSGASVAPAIRALDRLGVLDFLLPELAEIKDIAQSSPHIYDVWEHTLAAVQQTAAILDVLGPEYDPDKGGNLSLGLVALRLGRYRSQIHTHLNEPFTPDRCLRPLLYLAILYHDIAKSKTSDMDQNGRIRFFDHDRLGAEIVARRAAALRLSTLEGERVRRIVQYHMRPMLLAQGDGEPTRRAIYRFFRAAGEAGVDVCLLSLADFLATYGPALPQDAWSRHINVVRTLLEAWWENPTPIVSPPQLVKGKALMDRFGLPSGPQIGYLLAAIQEAQAVGEVTSQEEAMALVEKLLKDK